MAQSCPRWARRIESSVRVRSRASDILLETRLFSPTFIACPRNLLSLALVFRAGVEALINRALLVCVKAALRELSLQFRRGIVLVW